MDTRTPELTLVALSKGGTSAVTRDEIEALGPAVADRVDTNLTTAASSLDGRDLAVRAFRHVINSLLPKGAFPRSVGKPWLEAVARSLVERVVDDLPVSIMTRARLANVTPPPGAPERSAWTSMQRGLFGEDGRGDQGKALATALTKAYEAMVEALLGRPSAERVRALAPSAHDLVRYGLDAALPLSVDVVAIVLGVHGEEATRVALELPACGSGTAVARLTDPTKDAIVAACAGRVACAGQSAPPKSSERSETTPSSDAPATPEEEKSRASPPSVASREVLRELKCLALRSFGVNTADGGVDVGATLAAFAAASPLPKEDEPKLILTSLLREILARPTLLSRVSTVDVLLPFEPLMRAPTSTLTVGLHAIQCGAQKPPPKAAQKSQGEKKKKAAKRKRSASSSSSRRPKKKRGKKASSSGSASSTSSGERRRRKKDKKREAKKKSKAKAKAKAKSKAKAKAKAKAKSKAKRSEKEEKKKRAKASAKKARSLGFSDTTDGEDDDDEEDDDDSFINDASYEEEEEYPSSSSPRSKRRDASRFMDFEASSS